MEASTNPSPGQLVLAVRTRGSVSESCHEESGTSPPAAAAAKPTLKESDLNGQSLNRPRHAKFIDELTLQLTGLEKRFFSVPSVVSIVPFQYTKAVMSTAADPEKKTGDILELWFSRSQNLITVRDVAIVLLEIGEAMVCDDWLKRIGHPGLNWPNIDDI
eukprot:scpid102922/ scgid13094/ 